MKTLRFFEILISIMSNLMVFALLLATFILVFWYPEIVGAILGKITKAINDIIINH